MFPSSEDSSPALFTNLVNSQQMPNVLGNDNKQPESFPSPPVPPRPVSVVVNATFSANDQRQNSLDRQPGREGSNDVSFPPEGVTNATRSPVDTEEEYEPSMIPDTIHASVSDHMDETTNHNGHLQDIGSLPEVEGIPFPTNRSPQQSLEVNMINNDGEDIGLHEPRVGSDRSPPIADSNDSDDYEPPEPELTVEPSTLSPGVVVETKPLISSMSDSQSFSELVDLRSTPPVLDERSTLTRDSANFDEQAVRFLSDYSISLTSWPGYAEASNSRNKFLRAV